MQLSRFFPLGAAVVVAGLQAGCAGLNIKDAMPETKSLPPPPLIDRTVRVGEITGAEPGWGVLLDNAKMREALAALLAKSGLFRGVGADTSDLELQATILSTAVTKGRVPFFSMEVRRELVVTYEVVERTSRRSLMRETVRSEAGSVALGGADANHESTTLSLKENLRLLLETLEEKRAGVQP